MAATKAKARGAKETDAERELREQLADFGADAMQALYPSWSIDTLLTHPRCTRRVCRETARRMHRPCSESFEDALCRALLNARKRGDLKRDPV